MFEMFTSKKILVDTLRNSQVLIKQLEEDRRNLYNHHFKKDYKLRASKSKEYNGPVTLLKGCLALVMLRRDKKLVKTMCEFVETNEYNGATKYYYFDKSIKFVECEINDKEEN